MRRTTEDELVEGLPRARRRALAQWANYWMRIAQILVVPVGLLALTIAIYVSRGEIAALLR